MRSIFKYLCPLFLFAFVCLLAYFLFDSWQYQNYRANAKQIVVGDTKARVTEIMGNPTAIFGDTISKLQPQNEWCYGKEFGELEDWQKAFTTLPPFFWPFRFRLFSCDNMDVKVVFSNSRVSEIIVN